MDGTLMWDVNESKFTVLQKEKGEKNWQCLFNIVLSRISDSLLYNTMNMMFLLLIFYLGSTLFSSQIAKTKVIE